MERVGAGTPYTSLETSVEEARRSFACTFSSSDEFEAALIKNRREAGLYGPSAFQRHGAIAAGIALLVAICVVVF